MREYSGLRSIWVEREMNGGTVGGKHCWNSWFEIFMTKKSEQNLKKIRAFFWGILGIFSFGMAVCAQELPVEIASEFQRAGIPEEAVGIVIQPIGLSEPKVLHNAGTVFHPASTMKVLTTYAALELLGPSFTWQTGAYITGEVRHGILYGDLIIRGSGDPSFSQKDLWLFIRKIQDSGIREIRGKVVLDRSVFGRINFDASVFDDAPLKPYNAGPDGLLLNEKRIDVYFAPHGDKDEVEVVLEPRMEGITIVPPVAASSACGDWKNGITVHFDDKIAYFEGEYPLACGIRTWAIHPYQMSDRRYFESVFVKLWRESGGVFKGQVEEGLLPADAVLKAEWTSQELGLVVSAVNKYSNNVMARQLLLTLGEKFYGTGATIEQGIAVIGNWLTQKGISANGLVVENGSGLSREERISPLTMAEILNAAFMSPVMPELVSSLPIAGRDGTMSKRLRDDPIAGKAHIKTGAINDVRAIAGYVLAKSGRRYLIVCMINHPNAKAGRQVLNRLLSWAYENG